MTLINPEAQTLFAQLKATGVTARKTVNGEREDEFVLEAKEPPHGRFHLPGMDHRSHTLNPALQQAQQVLNEFHVHCAVSGHGAHNQLVVPWKDIDQAALQAFLKLVDVEAEKEPERS